MVSTADIHDVHSIGCAQPMYMMRTAHDLYMMYTADV